MMSFQDNNPKILVIGDLVIDHYLWGSCERISAEAPVQVIDIENENIVLGGAGNVINNLCSLEATVDVISVIGECEASNDLKDLLTAIKVNTQYLITQKDRVTSKKSRIIAAQQQVVRFDREISFKLIINRKRLLLMFFKIL